jgi:hypothetical protein
MIALLLALAAGAAVEDPCAPVAPGSGRDAAAAAAYLAVAQQEEQRGEAETARQAYRAALEQDPREARARAGLQRLCVHAGRSFEQGLRQMEAGDCAAAAASLAAFRAREPSTSAALLEGICRYELGQDAAARALLDDAARDERHAPEASFFSGLLALRQGDADDASARFTLAGRSRDPALRSSAASLERLSARSGRYTFSVLTASGFDSNADLAPDGSPNPNGSADGAGIVAASALARPLGESGPYGALGGSYRKLLRFSEFDVGTLQGALGWQLGSDRRSVRAEYGYDFLTLGGSPWLSAHRLTAGAREALGPVALAASYSARFESFRTSDTSSYSGTRHSAEASGELRLGALALGAGYEGTRDSTDEPLLAFWEHGPRAWSRWAASDLVRAGLDLTLLFRRYDLLDPAYGVARSDGVLDALLWCEVDLGPRFSLRGSAGMRRARSNVPAFVYTQLTGGVSLLYAVGLP